MLIARKNLFLNLAVLAFKLLSSVWQERRENDQGCVCSLVILAAFPRQREQLMERRLDGLNSIHDALQFILP